MQCIVVKSGEFENSSHLYYISLKILIMLLLAPYGRSAATTHYVTHALQQYLNKDLKILWTRR